MTSASGGSTSSDRPPVEHDGWDAGDMGCGELIVLLRGRIRALEPGQVLLLTAQDPAAPHDLPAWCRLTGHHLDHFSHPHYWIRRKDH